MTDFVGARASNAGDDYHELWVARQAIRLLSNESGLAAIAVEDGNLPDAPSGTWNGVDCTLYFGGTTLSNATHVEIVQVKYSTTKPEQLWTVSRLAQDGKDKSVFSRLAKAWKKIVEDNPTDGFVTVALVSNQLVHPELERTVQQMARASVPMVKGTHADRLAGAAGLSAQDLQKFASSFSFKCGFGSRQMLDEQVLLSIGKWSDGYVRPVVERIQAFVHRKMMPDAKKEKITKQSVLAHLGVSYESTLFPCPSQIKRISNPVCRPSVTKAAEALQSVQYLCLHGQAGIGKTTALQEIESQLPTGSIMAVYDCYGAGSYRDPSALRHRTKDAILQLTNEIAVRLRLPLFLLPNVETDYLRQFKRRLEHAATTLRESNPSSLIVIAIDAADNAVFAAEQRQPREPSFIHDFVKLADLPSNVRIILTARTGRRLNLQLPSNYKEFQVEAFGLLETTKSVSDTWPTAPQSWLQDFHHFSKGVPRVQAAAFASAGDSPQEALGRLMPDGKSLEDVFDERFQEAIKKGGAESTLGAFCAALIALPRPVPLDILACILDETVPAIRDVCLDLAPSITCEDGLVAFADEDLEEFVRSRGSDHIDSVETRVAELMLSLSGKHQYAASNVAGALLAAGLRSPLLDLVSSEPAPSAGVVPDPVLRRETELQRLRLAISVCREAEDVKRGLRFVLMGAESMQTEAALRSLLTENADLAVEFAQDAVHRLVLSDPQYIEEHGRFLFHRLAMDARLADPISVRQGRRKISAWLQVRETHRERARSRYYDEWDIQVAEISSMVEATLRLRGPGPAIEDLHRWRPRRIRAEVALTAPWRLLAEGRAHELAALATHLNAVESLSILVPLGLSGRPIDTAALAKGLRKLLRRRRSYAIDTREFHPNRSLKGSVADLLLTAAELLAAKGEETEAVRGTLDALLDGPLSQVENHSPYQMGNLDLLLRAHTLREVLDGRIPTVAGMFDDQEAEHDHRASSGQGDKRRVREIAQAAIGVYAAVAGALLKRSDSVEDSVAYFSNNQWALSHYGGSGLKGYLCTHISLLLLKGYGADRVWQHALRVFGNWQEGWSSSRDQFVERVRLWPALHEDLVEQLGLAAQQARRARTTAQEKIDLLTRYSRLLVPISIDEARAIFNLAVDVVGELDVEVFERMRLFNSLVVRGAGTFCSERSTAVQFAKVTEESALRLFGERHFPWDDAIAALVRLDLPLALAVVARWSDEGTGDLAYTLPPLLKVAVSDREMRPTQASALMTFLDGDAAVAREILTSADLSDQSALSEELAYDAVMRGVGDPEAILDRAPANDGYWVHALRQQRRFLASHVVAAAPASSIGAPALKAEDRPISYAWQQGELTDASCIEEVIIELLDDGMNSSWSDIEAVLETARGAVTVANRVPHLNALSELSRRTARAGAVVEALLTAIETWSNGLSVKEWARTTLPGVIGGRFADFASGLPYRGLLQKALALANLNAIERNEIVLTGLEQSVGMLSVGAILKLVEVVSANLAPSDAFEIARWYADHLAQGIEAADSFTVVGYDGLPGTADEGVARFLFAHLGDCDLRLRWRGAHSVRRLARMNDTLTIDALADEYSREKDPEFRSRESPFYWLAARLWFVMAFDAAAWERTEVVACKGELLKGIALDTTLPHVLIRRFARDACEKLAKNGVLSLTQGERRQLQLVDHSQLPRRRRQSQESLNGFGHRHKGYRFTFDPMDALPYWYDPALKSFADLTAESFLRGVEHWIVDKWCFHGDAWSADEGRRSRFENQYALTDNHHGTIPTIERARDYLQWHAMWCALGTFLESEPLAEVEYSVFQFDYLLEGRGLCSPPLWSADLARPTPLEMPYWRQDVESLDSWIKGVGDHTYMASLFSTDPPGYFCVDGASERRMSDRVEMVSVHSALATRATASSLVRALQTMDDNWDYRIPFEGEGEEVEFDEPPFCLLGWLRNRDFDDSSGMDGKDPFRTYGLGVHAWPGGRVIEACGLRCEGDRLKWVAMGEEEPMFVYQTWGADDRGQREGFDHTLAVCGHRLLVQMEQLQNFLRGSDWDLIVEVEVTRHDRKRRRFGAEDEEEGRCRVARVYRFGADGHYEAAERRLGTWPRAC